MLCALVGSIRREKLKILNPVILSIPVHMMHNLLRFKITPKMLFHYKAMLPHITMTVCVGVFWFQNQPVSPLVQPTATTPTGVLITLRRTR